MAIPYYTEINDFFASINLTVRTNNPAFFCHRLQQGITTYRPPFKRAFYFFALFNNYGKVQINYDGKTVNDPASYLVCHSPNLVYSFSHGNTLEGYIVYFKPECFSFFKPDFHKTFSFFNVLFTNLYNIDHATSKKLKPHFDEVFQTYERTNTEQHMEARIKLLALLYHIKQFTAEFNDGARFVSPQQVLLSKFMHLVNSHYIDKRTVREEVAQTIAKAKSLGATIYKEPADHGWMYQHSFADLDGHQWEYAYMDISQFPQQ